MNTIEQAMDLHGVRVGGVATAVRAAAMASLRHDHLARPTFAEVYRWVEPEIPYSWVDPAEAESTAR